MLPCHQRNGSSMISPTAFTVLICLFQRAAKYRALLPRQQLLPPAFKVKTYSLITGSATRALVPSKHSRAAQRLAGFVWTPGLEWPLPDQHHRPAAHGKGGPGVPSWPGPHCLCARVRPGPGLSPPCLAFSASLQRWDRGYFGSSNRKDT